ncbi:MAG: choice-of-anchor D domain-containing protein [Myxococcaceae bacterium]|nr:choice-of-anchor D domain-containing protein [Myxococcaceae bacterium]
MRLALPWCLAAVVAGCSSQHTTVEVEEAPPVARLQQAATWSQTMFFSGGIAATPGTPCPLCGGDWACTGVGTWGNGTKTFVDPVPAPALVTQVDVSVTYGCVRNGTASIFLNNVLVGTFGPGTSACFCSGTVCNTVTRTITNAAGVPGYVYGGTNSVRLSFSGPQLNDFCVRSIGVTVSSSDPVLVATPSSLTFGVQPAGTTSPTQSVSLRNMGPFGAVVRSSTVTGPFTAVRPPPNTVLAPDASVAWSVAYRADGFGSQTGSLELDTSAGVLTVPLTGTGQSGQLTVTPSPITFTDTLVGSMSTVPLTLENTGDLPLQVLSTSALTPFSVALPPAPFVLQPAQVISGTATFTPVSRGPASGLVFVNFDGGVRQLQVPLQGNALGAEASLTTVNHPTTPVGSSSSITATLTNTGDVPLVVTSVTAPAPFSIGNVTTPFTVDAGVSQSITVLFTPTARGTFTGMLATVSNAPASRNLRGVATGPAISIPAPFNVGVGAVGVPLSVALTVSNPGEATLQVTGAWFDGGVEFAVDGGVTSVPAGSSRPLQIVMTAAGTGTRRDTLLVTSNAGPLQVPVTGFGSGPAITIAPPALDGGTVRAGASATATLTISNPGDQALTISSALVSGPDAAQFSVVTTLPLSVPAAASRPLVLRFSPASPSAHVATLELTTNAPWVNPVLVPLGGRGATGVLDAPAVVELGVVQPGVTAQRTVSIGNVGQTSLTISSVSLRSDAGIFSVSAIILPRTLAVTETTSMLVSATPPTSAPFSDVIDLVTDAFDAGTQSIVVGVGTPIAGGSAAGGSAAGGSAAGGSAGGGSAAGGSAGGGNAGGGSAGGGSAGGGAAAGLAGGSAGGSGGVAGGAATTGGGEPGGGSAGGGSATGGGGAGATPAGCGCSSDGSLWGAWAVLLLALMRRR